MKTLGERIAELRRERGMTQENLAQTVGVSAQAISKWETCATMPDITLLPVLAGVFEVSIDALFSVENQKKKPEFPYEETPAAVYDMILNTMWSLDNGDVEKTRSALRDDPSVQSGFISYQASSVYAARDLALAWLPDKKQSLSLLENENTADFLAALADKAVRAVLSYMVQNPGRAFTASSAAAKTGLPETDVAEALEKLVKYQLSSGNNVDVGSDETLRVYQMYGVHKMHLMVYPLLYLAQRMAEFQETWFGLRA